MKDSNVHEYSDCDNETQIFKLSRTEENGCQVSREIRMNYFCPETLHIDMESDSIGPEILDSKTPIARISLFLLRDGSVNITIRRRTSVESIDVGGELHHHSVKLFNRNVCTPNQCKAIDVKNKDELKKE